jgi:hypothetical protein
MTRHLAAFCLEWEITHYAVAGVAGFLPTKTLDKTNMPLQRPMLHLLPRTSQHAALVNHGMEGHTGQETTFALPPVHGLTPR